MAASKQLAYARGISEIGNAFRYLALPIAIMTVHNSAKDLAVAETLATAGMFIGSLIVPSFIDRISKLKSLVISDLFSLFGTSIIAYGIFLNSFFWLLSGYFLITIIDTYHQSAMDAVTADLLTEARKPLLAGFSRLQLMVFGGGIVGGLAASQIVNKLPLYWLLGFDALSFVLSSIWVLRITQKNHISHIQERIKPAKKSHIQIALQEWRDGFRLSFKDLDIRKHIFCQSLIGVCYGITTSTVRGHLLTTLKISSTQLGYLAPSNKSFYLLGTLCCMWISRLKVNLKLISFIGAIGVTAAYFGMGMASLYPFFLLFYGIHQFGNALLTPANRTIVMGSSEPSNRGRVAAFRGLVIDMGTLAGNFLGIYFLSINTAAGIYSCIFFMGVILVMYLGIKKWE